MVNAEVDGDSLRRSLIVLGNNKPSAFAFACLDHRRRIRSVSKNIVTLRFTSAVAPWTSKI